MNSLAVYTEWRPSVVDWGGGPSASKVKLFAGVVNGCPHNAQRYH